jgi:hypothetical protein
MNGKKAPIAFIVDDAPVNAAYFARAQMKERGMAIVSRGSFGERLRRWEEMEKGKIVPNDFWKRFIDWAVAEGVRGKFTFLPCPAGLGYVDERVEGYTDRELAELVALIRDDYTTNFDITPEIFTHSLAWDVEKRELLPVTEWQWTDSQDEATLTHYMVEALRVLRSVGIIATGITQPCNFRGDEDLYARSVLAATKEVNGIGRTYYFLHADGDSPCVPSPVMIADEETGDCVVSVTSGSKADEPFWDTIYGDGDVREMADYFVSEDGASGRLVDLAQSGGPVVFHGHAQTLYSNGTQRGFEALQEVVRRINKHLGDSVQWMNMTELVEHAMADGEAGL